MLRKFRRRVFLCVTALGSAPCLFAASLPVQAFAIGNAKDGVSDVVQIVRVDAATHEALRNGTIEAKERRGLAMGAFGRYLSDFLKGSVLPEAKTKSFLQSTQRDFSKFVPSYRVEPGAAPEVRVSLLVSTDYLLAQLEKQGMRKPASQNAAQNSASMFNGNGAAQKSPGGAASGASGSGNGGGVALAARTVLPYTALLVDEKNRTIYVTPPEALSTFAIDNELADASGYRFLPAATLKAVTPTDTELNAVGAPLATRAAQFSNKILFHLQNRTLVFKPEWTKQILSFIETSARVGKERGETRAWPPALPWSLSSLYANPGLLAVFTVRSDDKAGVLERVELVGTQGGKFLRQYWSRPMQDPAYQETPAKALEKTAVSYARLARVKRPEASPGALAFWVDKRVSDKDIVAVENILRSFALGEDALLVPSEVTREDVRYASPVPASRADKVVERIRHGVTGVQARLAPGEPPVILLAPAASSKAP